ncbi:hypothetical protein NESM_000460500 [Novymonas esmeraldas]|uniref:Uncharacterized protein n=1 Tax=Novymonas esmeraldas TaxID=1808958 RepID=A0AAW0EMJ0_9TRYP
MGNTVVCGGGEVAKSANTTRRSYEHLQPRPARQRRPTTPAPQLCSEARSRPDMSTVDVPQPARPPPHKSQPMRLQRSAPVNASPTDLGSNSQLTPLSLDWVCTSVTPQLECSESLCSRSSSVSETDVHGDYVLDDLEALPSSLQTAQSTDGSRPASDLTMSSAGFEVGPAFYVAEPDAEGAGKPDERPPLSDPPTPVPPPPLPPAESPNFDFDWDTFVPLLAHSPTPVLSTAQPAAMSPPAIDDTLTTKLPPQQPPTPTGRGQGQQRATHPCMGVSAVPQGGHASHITPQHAVQDVHSTASGGPAGSAPAATTASARRLSAAGGAGLAPLLAACESTGRTAVTEDAKAAQTSLQTHPTGSTTSQTRRHLAESLRKSEAVPTTRSAQESAAMSSAETLARDSVSPWDVFAAYEMYCMVPMTSVPRSPNIDRTTALDEPASTVAVMQSERSAPLQPMHGTAHPSSSPAAASVSPVPKKRRRTNPSCAGASPRRHNALGTASSSGVKAARVKGDLLRHQSHAHRHAAAPVLIPTAVDTRSDLFGSPIATSIETQAHSPTLSAERRNGLPRAGDEKAPITSLHQAQFSRSMQVSGADQCPRTDENHPRSSGATKASSSVSSSSALRREDGAGAPTYKRGVNANDATDEMDDNYSNSEDMTPPHRVSSTNDGAPNLHSSGRTSSILRKASSYRSRNGSPLERTLPTIGSVSFLLCEQEAALAMVSRQGVSKAVSRRGRPHKRGDSTVLED